MHWRSAIVQTYDPLAEVVAGCPFDARADAEYFLSWIDRLEADLKKRDRIPVGLEQVQAQLGAAREYYRRLARSAPAP